MKRALLLTVLMLGCVAFVQAQQPYYNQATMVDVIYTNDGLVLQGTIVDQVPGVSYNIVTLDGRSYTLDALSIKRITKEQVAGVVTQNHIYHHDPYMVYKLDEDGFPIYPLSPATAFTRSLLMPGWGQIYNGEELKGTLLLSGAIVGILGITIGVNVINAPEDLVGYSSLALLGGCYLYSLIEAPLFAARWNKKHGFKLNGRSPSYVECSPAMGVVGCGADSSAAVGMHLSVSF